MKTTLNTLTLLLLMAVCGCQLSNGQTNKITQNRPKSKTDAEWKKILTPDQYYILVERGTEPPFKNPYYNFFQKGVYVSPATGDVLFLSDDKYDSGEGWPSFVKPADPNKIEIITDNSEGMTRDEVIEKSTGLHLGHVFNDGPANRGGKRYCIDSYALKFIKK